jgi:hypothetical protein
MPRTKKNSTKRVSQKVASSLGSSLRHILAKRAKTGIADISGIVNERPKDIISGRAGN